MKTKIYTFTAIILLAGMIFHQDVIATTHQVQVSNYTFTPSSLNVTVGDTVKWNWVSGSHTTTSSGIPAGASAWDQPINSSHTTYSYKVTVAGNYSYVCTPHAAMGMTASFIAAEPVNALAISPGSRNVGSSAGSTSFTVTSNTSWTSSSDQSWCTVTLSGTGNGTITAIYTANSTGSQRTAMITVSAAGVPDQMVSINQDATGLQVNDPAAETFTVAPNPVRSVLRIFSGSLKTSAEEIKIYNINGGRVLGPITISGNPASIDISALSEGIYFIRIGRDGQYMLKKIVKIQ